MSEQLAPAVDIAALQQLLHSDPAAAATQLRQAALAGDVNAQFLVAQMHAEGRLLQHDPGTGFHWFMVAANAGHALAMNMVGRCFELGQGTPVDLPLAGVWYRKAAEHGLDWGMYNQANLLATGRGMAANPKRALQLYLQAAELGHAKSMNLVGRYLEEGLETPRDLPAAHAWYRKSALAGDFRGQASHAAVLAEAGRLQEAEHWLRIAIRQGSATFLATMRQTLEVSPHPSLRTLVALVETRQVA